MFRKKTLIRLATAALVAVSAAAQAADTATVTVTAKVVDNTCTPKWTSAGVNVTANLLAKKDFGSDKVGEKKCSP